MNVLNYIDEYIYEFLNKNIDIMPMRLKKLIAFFYTDARIRKKYLNELGVKMGNNTFSNLGFKITVSGDCNEKYQIEIGDNVSIAPNVTIIADSCANNGVEINQIKYVKEKLTINKKVIVEDEVWLGANVTILPGVRIGRCSIIGAGSVVVDDVEEYSIYVGVPAKKIRNLR